MALTSLAQPTRPTAAELHEALRDAGFTQTEAAKLFGVSRQTIGSWVRSTWYRAYVDDIARAAFVELKSKAREDLELARNTLRELMTDDRIDDKGRPVIAGEAKRSAAATLIGVHERLAPLGAPAADTQPGEGAKALDIIRQAKAAAEARREATGAPKPVESNV